MGRFGWMETVEKRVCTVCNTVLSKGDTVMWSDSGLPASHLACGKHIEEAWTRLRNTRDSDGRMFSRVTELELENERLRERTRTLTSAVTDMADLVTELQQKLKERMN